MGCEGDLRNTNKKKGGQRKLPLSTEKKNWGRNSLWWWWVGVWHLQILAVGVGSKSITSGFGGCNVWELCCWRGCR